MKLILLTLSVALVAAQSSYSSSGTQNAATGTDDNRTQPGYLPDYQGDKYTDPQRIKDTQALNAAFFQSIGGAPSPPPLTPAQQGMSSGSGTGSGTGTGSAYSNTYNNGNMYSSGMSTTMSPYGSNGVQYNPPANNYGMTGMTPAYGNTGTTGYGTTGYGTTGYGTTGYGSTGTTGYGTTGMNGMNMNGRNRRSLPLYNFMRQNFRV